VGRDRTTGIIDYYRWCVEGDRAAADVISDDTPAVRLRAPNGVSEVWGKSGRRYPVGEDGFVSVLEPDALPLRIAGAGSRLNITCSGALLTWGGLIDLELEVYSLQRLIYEVTK
jgi:hypothetical protein